MITTARPLRDDGAGFEAVMVRPAYVIVEYREVGTAQPASRAALLFHGASVDWVLG
jgi:hypothetical protein